MEEYKKVLADLKEILQKEEVEETEEVISAYDLYHRINERLEDLREVRSEDFLTKPLNKEKSPIIKVMDILEKIVFGSMYKYGITTTYSDEHFSTIKFFYFEENWQKKTNYVIGRDAIFRGKLSGDVHFISGLDKKTREKHHDRIMYGLSVLDDAYDLFGKDISASEHSYETAVDFEGTKVALSIMLKDNGEIEMFIIANPETNNKKCFDQTTPEFVDNNKDELLKRIPVKISELNPTIKRVYERSKKEKPKQRIR